MHRICQIHICLCYTGCTVEGFGFPRFIIRVFIMVAHSVCGALPLGIIVTSDEKEQTLVDALQLYKSSMPDFGFYGASLSGPRIFMTDNCYELREALKKSGPKQQQLCISMFFNRYSQYFYCFSLYSLLVLLA